MLSTLRNANPTPPTNLGAQHSDFRIFRTYIQKTKVGLWVQGNFPSNFQPIDCSVVVPFPVTTGSLTSGETSVNCSIACAIHSHCEDEVCVCDTGFSVVGSDCVEVESSSSFRTLAFVIYLLLLL